MTNGVQNNLTIPYSFEQVDDSNLLRGAVVTENEAREIESNFTDMAQNTSLNNPANSIHSLIESINFQNAIEETISLNGVMDTDAAEEIAYDIKDQIDNIVSKVTDQDIQELIKNNYNPEKVSLDIFEKIVEDNKGTIRTGNIERLESDIEKEIKSFSELFDDEETLSEVITNLNEKNLPTSKQNIGKVYDALDKANAIKDISDENVLNLMKNQSELTISNIYKGSFTPPSSEGFSQDIEALEPQVAAVLENHGGIVSTGDANMPSDAYRITNTEENIDLAKRMITSDMELNDESLFKVEAIREGLDNLDNSRVIDRAVNNIAQNKPVADISIIDDSAENMGANINYSQEALEEMVSVLPRISDSHIQSLVESGEVINIQNLAKEVASSSGAVEGIAGTTSISESTPLGVVQARLNLEEIRLKMTVEAASKLNAKGFEIDTQPLEAVVSGLREQEREGLSNLMSHHGLEKSEENVNTVQDVFERVNTLKNMPASVYGQVVSKEIGFTIGEMSDETRATIDASEAIKNYEASSTIVRRDLGDSIEKAFENMDSLLEGLEIDVTPENERAVTILGRNGMEITQENIDAVSLVDAKVSKVTEGLHPNVVVTMINENLSPVDMHVDEVLDYVSEFEALYGETDIEAITQGILKLDQSNILSSDERDSVIGTYRMLMTISKSRGAAAGFLTKNDMDLSLDNLFEAAKYIKSTLGETQAIDASVDDDFGMLEEVNYDGRTIKDQVEAALTAAEIPPTRTNLEIATELVAAGETLTEASHTKASLNYQEIEQFISEYTGANRNDGAGLEYDTNEIIDSLKEMSEANNIDFEAVQKYSLTNSIREISVAIKLQNNGFEMGDTLNNLVGKLEDNDIDTSSLQEAIDNLSKDSYTDNYQENLSDLREEMASIIEEITHLNGETKRDIASDTETVNNLLGIQRAMADADNYYQIPMMISGEMSQLNMYYVNNDSRASQGEDDSMSVYLYFDTKSLGSVQAYMNINNNRLDLNIFAEDTENLEAIKGFGEEITSILNKSKYSLNDIEYKYFEGESPINEQIASDKVIKPISSSSSQFEVII